MLPKLHVLENDKSMGSCDRIIWHCFCCRKKSIAKFSDTSRRFSTPIRNPRQIFAFMSCGFPYREDSRKENVNLVPCPDWIIQFCSYFLFTCKSAQSSFCSTSFVSCVSQVVADPPYQCRECLAPPPPESLTVLSGQGPHRSLWLPPLCQACLARYLPASCCLTSHPDFFSDCTGTAGMAGAAPGC